MATTRMLVLAAMTRHGLAVVIRRLPPELRRGHPWSCSLPRRILIACTALRTNLTFRELFASFAISRSAAHRIGSTLTPRLATRADQGRRKDRLESWVLDGTLIPTRDHRRAARSKNDRWSCNAQVLIRRRDLRIIATTAGVQATATTPCTTAARASRRSASSMVARSPTAATAASPTSSRRGSVDARSCATGRGVNIVDVEPGSKHAIARLKTWRVLRDPSPPRPSTCGYPTSGRLLYTIST